MEHSRFLMGNVIQRKGERGSLYVVIKVDSKSTQMIPIDGVNCTTYAQHEKTYRKVNCNCYIDQRCPDRECEECLGTGMVERQNIWIGDYKYIDSTIKAFIINRLLKFERYLGVDL